MITIANVIANFFIMVIGIFVFAFSALLIAVSVMLIIDKIRERKQCG